MLTIKAEINPKRQRNDGTYNVKIRLIMNRKVIRLSTSLFVRPEDLTKNGKIKESSPIRSEADNLVLNYRNRCNEMLAVSEERSLDDIVRILKFKEKQDRPIDFISFSREWIRNAGIKGAVNYKCTINSLTAFTGRNTLNISEINISFLNRYSEYLEKRRKERVWDLMREGKRVPSDRAASLYLGSLRHLYKEAQRKYNDFDNNLILLPRSPFDYFKVPRQKATRKKEMCISYFLKELQKYSCKFQL